jgi:hypothetical protein
MTILVTRMRKRFWQVRPAAVLLVAVLATQAVATLVAACGRFMTPIGWTWAAAVVPVHPAASVPLEAPFILWDDHLR